MLVVVVLSFCQDIILIKYLKSLCQRLEKNLNVVIAINLKQDSEAHI